ncbi:NlpC/P60 family protein [Ginsengibacter hankyongi]|uniref:NlpC/P60 family protein n=1 Tax=Ginsengibacter hankyongi TaxID=2607284 RepID=A0A5J5ILA3_9BACT|nr:C40 family peptidase [Ginsengibacter hankyongi]KAA9041779.1 NlpC/P60 family protein [Ginsengibacter hankyongi]
MKYVKQITVIIGAIFFLQSCSTTRRNKSSGAVSPTELPVAADKINKVNNAVPPVIINTKNIAADSIVYFAKTLIGVRYKYGSAIKEQGFDCSGFITYVFNHFKIQVPRISKDFTNAGTPVSLDESKPGDLILFTGTDTNGWIVGHMGIITQNENGKIQFIHSASGKSIGVIISGMSKYFETRLVKVIRVFTDEDY